MSSRWKEFVGDCPDFTDPQCAPAVDYIEKHSSKIRFSRANIIPDLAIVVAAYNEQFRLPRTLASVNEAVGSYPNARVVVVDNGSTDETGHIARAFGADVVVEKMKGISYARQAGLEATTKFESKVLTTDADTVVPEEWIYCLASSIVSEYVLSYGRIRYMQDGDFNQKREIELNLFNKVSQGIKKVRERKQLWPTSCNLGFLREYAIEEGGYTKGINRGEEGELATKLAKHGNIRVLDDLVVETSDRRVAGTGISVYAMKAARRSLNFIFRGKGMVGSDYKDFR